MINLKNLRKTLESTIELAEWNTPSKEKMSDRITISRKKKMVLVEQNGNVKTKRKSYIKIEIVE